MPYILHAKRDAIADWFESQEVLDLAIDGHDETHFLDYNQTQRHIYASACDDLHPAGV
jgi:hypothetical protein